MKGQTSIRVVQLLPDGSGTMNICRAPKGMTISEIGLAITWFEKMRLCIGGYLQTIERGGQVDIGKVDAVAREIIAAVGEPKLQERRK